ncbi:hypothetical protein [Aureivirga sp. CE67]|uniref:hypothetical protein n=1 Tax=Aureivirga sp. CE67 TaxID=1788983 RepID=UPI0018CB3DB6|nr:hypothetical protein [Aureivirga sp. CE67]
MTVKEFILKFEEDVHIKNKTYNEYEKWHTKFYNKTLQYHTSVKESYFMQMNAIIDKAEYKFSNNKELLPFTYLGLFNEKDQAAFDQLIQKLISNIKKIDTNHQMEEILNFICWLMDFILHEFYPEGELLKSIKKLKLEIIKSKKLDLNHTRCQVIRFIDLMREE